MIERTPRAARRRHGRAAALARGADRASEILAHAGMALISLFMILQIVEIVGRKTIGYSILGLSEMGQLLVMSCICLVLPFVFIRDGHIAVEFVTDALPARALSALKAAVAMASTLFVFALAYFGLGQAWSQILKGDASPTLAIPIAWFWIPLLIGVAASALACLIQTIRHAGAALGGAAVASPP